MNNKNAWILCRIAVGILIILTFTPFVTPIGRSDPFFLGMPYTLWSGILISITLVILTWIATMVHPCKEQE